MVRRLMWGLGWTGEEGKAASSLKTAWSHALSRSNLESKSAGVGKATGFQVQGIIPPFEIPMPSPLLPPSPLPTMSSSPPLTPEG